MPSRELPALIARNNSKKRLDSTKEERLPMAEESTVIRDIDWKSTFPWVNIFRSFRIAIHPSKIILALLALLAVYLGGMFLDAIWPNSHNAVPGEIWMYEDSRTNLQPTANFRDARDAARADLQRSYDQAKAGTKQGANATLGDVDAQINIDRDTEVDAANTAFNSSSKTAADARERDRRVSDAFEKARSRRVQAHYVNGVGLFESFYYYEVGQVNLIARAIRYSNWIGGGSVTQGVFNFLVNGPSWAMSQHWFFFTIYFLFFLSIWSIFGGAIARIAAVHVARDEKISIRQALRFSTSKFLSFLSAPIIPMLIVLIVGLVVAIGGILTNIPFIGPIIVGALFFLALAAGFVMTLVILGLIGGFNLMYPTIAVEGSDSFDAISRSFSYLYARPWRLGFYTMVAVIYGGLTYAFVRFFIYLILIVTHLAAGLFVFTQSDSHAWLWNAMWPGPLINGRLAYSVDFGALGPGQKVGAFFILVWVYLVVALLGAFVISFYFSANTVIYYLMRREVDATELDDVYLEQVDEDFAETAPVITTPAAPVSSASPTDQPPVTTEAGGMEPRTPGESVVDRAAENAGEAPEVGKPIDSPNPPSEG
jgi:hypothetical protein